MDKTWFENKSNECKAVKSEIKKLVKSLNMPDKDYHNVIAELDKDYGDVITFLTLKYMKYCGKNNDFDEDYANFQKWITESNIEDLVRKYKNKHYLENYLDMSMEFNGDILITDPCYITKTHDDWLICNRGSDMEKLGISHYMTRDTLYGDWSCTTYNLDTKEKIGDFCADAGLVSVFLLDEVLAYNPDFDWYESRPWATTLIKDFKGTVEFVVKYRDGYYKDETKYHKKGERWEEYYLEVIGHGVNKVTGKAINFIGKQTGL